MSLKKQNTEEKKILINLFFLFTLVNKRNQISSECVAFEEYMRRGLKSFFATCSPFSLLPMVQFSQMFSLPARFVSSASVSVDILQRLLSCCHTQIGFNIAVSSVELTGFGCRGLYFTDQLTWTWIRCLHLNFTPPPAPARQQKETHALVCGEHPTFCWQS